MLGDGMGDDFKSVLFQKIASSGKIVSITDAPLGL
jgi:hypothetical protein